MLQGLKDLGIKSFVAIAPNDEYGTSALEPLQSLAQEVGLEYKGSELFAPGATDVTPELSKLQQRGAEALFVASIMPADVVVAKNMQTMGYRTTVVHGSGAASETFVSDTGAAGDDHLVLAAKTLVPGEIPADDPAGASVRSFAEDFEAKTVRHSSSRWRTSRTSRA
jgi:ABC-type branched-subunit amino acid transport system substrate-binding protein